VLELLAATTKEHKAEEAADVLFFLVCLLEKNNIDILDVIELLKKRNLAVTKRPGNIKVHDIDLLSGDRR
jgi:phosphoribosyl-ATP pyrophosphohydrolase